MKNPKKYTFRWLSLFAFILMFSLLLTACGDDEYYDEDEYEPVAEEGDYEEPEFGEEDAPVVEEAPQTGAVAPADLTFEIFNQTDVALCWFLAAPENAEEYTDEHVFAEEELDPGDSFRG